MGNSLRDQMLKQGLVNKKAARKAEHEEKVRQAELRKARKAAGKAAAAGPDAEAAETARKALEEKAVRDRETNLERERQRAEAELRAQARDMILSHEVKPGKKEATYNFVDGKVVKPLKVSHEQQRELGNGKLAIAVIEETYYLVPADIAIKLDERAPEMLVVFNEPDDGEPREDDPYAEFPVPDDLMW